MQGDVSFDSVPLLKNTGIQAHVGGPSDPQNNYVIADHAGIILTGLDFTEDVKPDKPWDLAGWRCGEHRSRALRQTRPIRTSSISVFSVASCITGKGKAPTACCWPTT